MRLQRYLAQCGIASRRKCEEIIAQGRVTVNGQIIRQMGVQVTPGVDAVAVDGQPVSPEQRHIYIVLYKPVGVITSVTDPQGRRTVMDLLPPDIKERVYPVGRLDYDSEGIVLLTNDGDFANAVTHPRNQVPKWYAVSVSGRMVPEKIRALERGIMLDGKPTAPARIIDVRYDEDGSTRFRIQIHEGRKRQIRRMVRGVGHQVRSLRREQVGPVTLAGLSPGQWRELTRLEVKKLKDIGRHALERG